eukprot:TRINITY_DN6602_c0_g1_i1.p1 TRINITY_DN6602_c0_g1~~TRINITY_DN6602_c0_g1_i1.p1  ORF type:complete len:157 (+),score=11.05 TRINITY_DN6602_c0_g1_i1:435-905(+)
MCPSHMPPSFCLHTVVVRRDACNDGRACCRSARASAHGATGADVATILSAAMLSTCLAELTGQRGDSGASRPQCLSGGLDCFISGRRDSQIWPPHSELHDGQRVPPLASTQSLPHGARGGARMVAHDRNHCELRDARHVYRALVRAGQVGHGGAAL